LGSVGFEVESMGKNIEFPEEKVVTADGPWLGLESNELLRCSFIRRTY
jgi:hypothetical protein